MPGNPVLDNSRNQQTGEPTGTLEERNYEHPVAWLLGRQFIGSLKGTLLYTAFGSKIDPRDWMEACCIKYEEMEEDEEFWFDYIADTGDGMRATYSIAYLSMGDLWVKESESLPPRDEDQFVKLDEANNFG